MRTGMFLFWSQMLIMCAALAFEVMDKELPLWLVLLSFVGLGILGMLIGRRWPVASVLVLLLIAFGSARQLAELNDPYVGPAIKAEAGISYAVLSYLAILSSVLLVTVGTIKGWRQRRSKSTSS